VSQDPHPPSTPLIRRGVVRPPSPLLTPSALHFFCTSKSIFQKKPLVPSHYISLSWLFVIFELIVSYVYRFQIEV